VHWRCRLLQARLGCVFIIALLLPSCAWTHYRQTRPGKLKGSIIVQVLGDDQFIFMPHETDPLYFVRSDGRRIAPSRPMYTDGGSIPRFLWGFRNYSPWGYAHAFILHDWLFEAKRCHIPGYGEYTVEDAAHAMSEAMKTYIEARGKQPREEVAVYAVFEAVRSPIARDMWDHGTCRPLPASPEATGRVLYEYVIKFP